MKAEKELRIGGLGPLTLPGLPWAGRELRDGTSLAVQQLNGLDGVMGRRLTLLFEDTHGRREPGVAAVERLFEKSAHALAAEFHSVVANAIVEQVERRGLPFVCASATLDDITTRRLGFVFRLAPPQSYGWTIYADCLASQGFRHVVALQEDSPYWNNGSRAIEIRLRHLGVRFTRLSVRPELADAASWIRQVNDYSAIGVPGSRHLASAHGLPRTTTFGCGRGAQPWRCPACVFSRRPCGTRGVSGLVGDCRYRCHKGPVPLVRATESPYGQW